MKKNTTSITKAIGKGLFLFLLAGTVACGGEAEVAETEEVVADMGVEEDVVGTDTWDTDYYYTTFAGTNYYEDWDLDDDNFLNDDEFTTSFYNTWDTDNDGAIEEAEWTTVTADYNLENADWATWDADGDGLLEENEFDTGFANYGWYDTWDVDNDNLVTEREYTDGIFGIWDENDDNMLDTNEFGAYNSYFGI